MAKLLLRMLLAWFIVANLSGCDDEQARRAEILRNTPLGSTMEQVAAFCVRSNIKCKRSDNAGYVNRQTGEVVGKKSIWGTVAETKLGLMVSTSEAYWGFNSEGALVDVWVWRTTDAP